MKNLISELRRFIQIREQRAIVEVPPKSEFGHVSTNLPVFISKDDVDIFVNKLINEFPIQVQKCELMGNFLNIFLEGSVLKDQIMIYKTQNTEPFNLEFCSPNPTGPLHIGHLRNIIIGNSIYNLMKLCGFNIQSENYINDQGNQINQFIDTIRHYKNPSKYSEIYYKGEYVKDVANKVSDYVIKEDVIKVIMNQINSTLSKIFVKFDNVVFESSLSEYVHFIMSKLGAIGLLEEGTMENQKSEGNMVMAKYNDERFVLQKSNGEFTYFAFDLAYFYYKFIRLKCQTNELNPLLIVLAEDHYTHIKKLTVILEKLNIHIKVIKYAMVNVIKNAEIMQMSKREGTLVTINDMLKDIDIQDLTAEIMKQNFNKVLTISLDKKIQENEMFYVKYVYNRVNNILMKFSDDLSDEPITLDTPIKNTLFTLLMHYSTVLEKCTEDFNTHRIFDFSMKVIRAAYDYLINSNDFNENIMLILKTHSVITHMDRIFSLNLVFELDSNYKLFDDEISDLIQDFKSSKLKPEGDECENANCNDESCHGKCTIKYDD